MKFCMVTTFFGAHSFGGDAAYVERLSQALVRRGHEVHVFFCVDAFESVRNGHPLRNYTPPEGLHLHPLKSRFGILSPIATQATGHPILKAGALREHLDDPATDVVHFHNISLIGGPGVLKMGEGAVRLMTAHEHWLTCPMHLLWKMGRESCKDQECLKCVLHGRRPPQLWRQTSLQRQALEGLDALIFPSRHALQAHRDRGIVAPRMQHLPYFLPDEWSGGIEDQEPLPDSRTRPYLAAAGRLVKMKGFHRLIPLMRLLPEVDLRLAGTGPEASSLRALAAGLPNVHFEGLLSGPDLARLFHGARGVVVPSLFPETFGYVVLEAFSVRTPVVVHQGGGAIHETGYLSGGGLSYRSDDECLLALRRIVHDPELRDELADQGYRMRITDWSEAAHLDRYLSLIGDLRLDSAHTALRGPHTPVTRLSRSLVSDPSAVSANQ